ncbi:RNA polymerase sigma factor [Mucilaginibacter sp. HD30]
MSNNHINYMLLAESELIMLLKSDDKQALEQLYNNYKVRLYRTMLRLVKTEEQAGKILREVFVKIWIDRENIDPGKPFRNHIFKTAENLVYEIFREAALNKRRQNYFIITATSNIGERQVYRNGSTGRLFQAIDLS